MGKSKVDRITYSLYRENDLKAGILFQEDKIYSLKVDILKAETSLNHFSSSLYKFYC